MPKAPKKSSGGGKKISPYQAYMKRELKAIKAANPGLDHKEAFKKVRARPYGVPCRERRSVRLKEASVASVLTGGEPVEEPRG
jgi:hypothetical protein